MSRSIRACIKQQPSNKAHENSKLLMRKEAVSDWKRELEWHCRPLAVICRRKPIRPQSLYWFHGVAAIWPWPIQVFPQKHLMGRRRHFRNYYFRYWGKAVCAPLKMGIVMASLVFSSSRVSCRCHWWLQGTNKGCSTVQNVTGSVMANALVKKEDEEDDVTCRQGRRRGNVILVHQQ
jgi:hypothetical protein